MEQTWLPSDLSDSGWAIGADEGKIETIMGLTLCGCLEELIDHSA